MSNETTNCLRCGALCRRGVPDEKARAIRQSATEGFCPNCMITKFMLSIELIRGLIDGTAREAGLGPEIFLDSGWRETTFRPVMAGVLAHTQMREDSINWIEVVGNWGLEWPDGREPKDANY